MWGIGRGNTGEHQGDSTIFGFARRTGLLRFARRLRLNNHGLVILCYHGISRGDEHQWRSSLYLPPTLFRRRLEAVRRCGIQVLPLGLALDQVRNGGFSTPSLAITFDDGWQDFYSLAWPILREFGYPATVYQTSFYSAFNRPVFDTAVSYLLWKGRGQSLRFGEITGVSAPISLDSHSAIEHVTRAVLARTTELKLSAEEKDGLLAQIAEELGIDYQHFLSSRTLHLMNAAEIAEVAKDGADVQLHTHRHDLPLTKEKFLQEIATNRNWIEAVTGKPASHFCYPNGTHHPQFGTWLRDAQVKSATTCEPGIVCNDTDIFRLPRLTDSSNVSESRFEAWLSGVGLLGLACKRALSDRNRAVAAREQQAAG